jgi:hypothetical protein
MPLGDLINFLANWGLMSKDTAVLLDRLNKYVDEFIYGDKEGLYTTSWWIVAQKPPVGSRAEMKAKKGN